jgi:hypothetical protein
LSKIHNILSICQKHNLRLWIDLLRCLECPRTTGIKVGGSLEQWWHVYSHVTATRRTPPIGFEAPLFSPSIYIDYITKKKPKKQSTTSFVSFSFLSQICWDQDFDAIRVYVIVGEGQRELTSISWLLLWLAWRREKVVGY